MKPKYSKEELEFIAKWGYKSDVEYDTTRNVKDPITGKRITCLELAKMNKRAEEKIKLYKKLHGL